MSRRLSWLIALVIVVSSGALMGLLGQSSSAEQSPVPVPDSAESARADAAREAFPGSDEVPVILVVTRTDGAPLDQNDLQAVEQARQRMLTAAGATAPPGPPTQVSDDGQAALATVPLDADLSGFALTD
ncbi:Mmpl, partial [Mycobacterium sp. PO1]